MRKIKLTKEEKTIEDALVRGDYVRVSNAELKEVRELLAARKKDQTMTIRVNSEDIKKIKKKAEKVGIRYQTYITEVLHRVAIR